MEQNMLSTKSLAYGRFRTSFTKDVRRFYEDKLLALILQLVFKLYKFVCLPWLYIHISIHYLRLMLKLETSPMTNQKYVNKIQQRT